MYKGACYDTEALRGRGLGYILFSLFSRDNEILVLFSHVISSCFCHYYDITKPNSPVIAASFSRDNETQFSCDNDTVFLEMTKLGFPERVPESLCIIRCQKSRNNLITTLYFYSVKT